MSKSIEVAVYDEADNERIVEVYDYTLHESTPHYFSRSAEQWYPGDDAEFYVEGARWAGTGDELTNAEWELYGKQIEERAYEVAAAAYEPDYDPD